MKIADLKHNHSLTDLLKVSLFSILMLAPMLSVGVRSLYVICNKNAYQSYQGRSEQNITNEIITNTDQFIEGNTYNIRQYNNIDNLNINELNNNIVASEVNYNLTTYEDIRIGFYATGTSVYIYLRELDNLSSYIYQSDMRTVDTSITFVFESITSTFNSNLLTYFYEVHYNSNYYMDNVFEYSVSQLANDDLFSWTQETAIFTGVKAMTDQLEVNTLAIPVILTYWFLLTVIYVIIDIILKCFTVLTHLIGSKTA